METEAEIEKARKLARIVMQIPRIVINILQHFNYREQLELTVVNRLFRNIIIEYIWRQKYSKIQIWKTLNNYILTNTYINCTDWVLKENKIILSNSEFKKFILLNAWNITDITFWLGQNLLEQNPPISFSIQSPLPNLHILTLMNTQVTDNCIRMLIQFCPRLQSLYCEDEDERPSIVYHELENLQSIETLQNWEIRQSISCVFGNHESSNSEIQMVYRERKLKQLKLEINFNDEDEDYEEEFVHGNPMTIIRDSTLFEPSSLAQNLTDLTISSNQLITAVNREFFDMLLSLCQNLEYLDLKGFKISNFVLPTTLNELMLEDCLGLAWLDLKYILTELQLTAFTTIETEYSGEIEGEITTPETLRYLVFDNPLIAQLLQMPGFNGFRNVETIIYKNSSAEILKNIPINCPKVEILQLTNDCIPTDDLQQLESLEILEYTDYSDITNLKLIIKHPTLESFKIKSSINCDVIAFAYDATYDLETNLLLINMDWALFQRLLYYWLDLLNYNPQLNIVINIQEEHILLMRDVLTHSNFPKRLKTIKICGFNMECEELLKNFDAAIEDIIQLETHAEFPNKSHTIVL